MIATLPMYDRPETASANDALWAGVASRLGLSVRLTRDVALEDGWTDPALVLSQTCGLPYALWLHPHVRYVASPDFRLPDTPKGHYHSVIIARRDDDRSLADLFAARVIVNDRQSQSGCNALWHLAQSMGVPVTKVLVSGAHRASAQAVADKVADIAAIDANTWRMIEKWDGFAEALRCVARTPPTPAMPFVCSPARDPGQARTALAAAIADLTAEEQAVLGLYGLTCLGEAEYRSVPIAPIVERPE